MSNLMKQPYPYPPYSVDVERWEKGEAARKRNLALLLSAGLVIVLIVTMMFLSNNNPAIAVAQVPSSGATMVARDVGFYNDVVNADNDDSNNYNYGIDVYELATKAGCVTNEEYNKYFQMAILWIGDPVASEEFLSGAPEEFPMADPLWVAQQAFHQDYVNADNADWVPILHKGESINEARDRFMNDPAEGGDWDKTVDRLYLNEVDNVVSFEIYELTSYVSQGYTMPRNVNGNELPEAVQMDTVNVGGHAWKRTYASGVAAESRPECMFQWILPPGVSIPGVPVYTPPTTPLEPKDPSQDPARQGNAPTGGGKNDDPGPGKPEPRPSNPPEKYVPPTKPKPETPGTGGGSGSTSPDSPTHTGSEDPSGDKTKPGGDPTGSGSSDTGNSGGYNTPPTTPPGGGTVTDEEGFI